MTRTLLYAFATVVAGCRGGGDEGPSSCQQAFTRYYDTGWRYIDPSICAKTPQYMIEGCRAIPAAAITTCKDDVDNWLFSSTISPLTPLPTPTGCSPSGDWSGRCRSGPRLTAARAPSQTLRPRTRPFGASLGLARQRRVPLMRAHLLLEGGEQRTVSFDLECERRWPCLVGDGVALGARPSRWPRWRANGAGVRPSATEGSPRASRNHPSGVSGHGRRFSSLGGATRRSSGTIKTVADTKPDPAWAAPRSPSEVVRFYPGSRTSSPRRGR
jgi:hypothetical protein